MKYYPKMEQEIKTVEAMLEMYCDDHHSHKDKLCDDCKELLDYAKYRLDRCPLKENKPACAKCSIHCYSPYMRENIKSVMRYSGPRMIFKHPALALRHLIKSRKKIISKK